MGAKWLVMAILVGGALYYFFQDEGPERTESKESPKKVSAVSDKPEEIALRAERETPSPSDASERFVADERTNETPRENTNQYAEPESNVGRSNVNTKAAQMNAGMDVVLPSQEEAEKIAEKSVNLNLKKEFSNYASVAESPHVSENLSGRFRGTVNFPDNPNEPWNVDLYINGKVKDNHFGGRYQLSLFTEEQAISDSTIDGGLDENLKIGATKNPSIVLKTTQKANEFLQLFWVEAMTSGKLYGNYYRTVNDKLVRVGTVNLEKNI